MRNLLTVFSCRLDKALAQWLHQEHYPFAIDNSNGKLLAFNLSWDAMKSLIAEFDIHDFAIYLHPRQLKQPELCAYVDKAIGDSAWLLVNAMKGKGANYSIPSRLDVFLKAFKDYDYTRLTKHLDATELRAHICEGLYGIDNYDFTHRLDYGDMQEPVSKPNSDIIKNVLILTFRKFPELQVGQSCLGSEVWAYDSDKIIVFNLPTLSLDLIASSCTPEAIRYCEDNCHELDSALFRYVHSEMEAIRETHHLSANQRIPFTLHLQGIDAFQFNK